MYRLSEEIELEIEWKGLEIHPEFPREGVPSEVYLSQNQRTLLWRNVKDLAQEGGLEMKMPARLSKSELSLLGGQFSKEKGRLKEYSRAIYRAYFSRGQDIGSLQVLREALREAGMDSEEFSSCLGKGQLKESLEAYQREAQDWVVTAVPTFMIAGKRLVGAQPIQVLKEAVLFGNQ